MAFLRSNRALLARFRAGEPDALEAVYWEYVRKIERLLSEGFGPRARTTRVTGVERRLDDLADLVQEVFLRAFSEKARRSYDGLRDFGPYLYAIARNVLTDWNRSRSRELVRSGPAFEASVEETAVTDEAPPWSTPTMMQLVESYLAELPQQLKLLHRLRYEVGMSQEQAAKGLGVSRQTLRTLEKRLRDGLSDRIGATTVQETDQPDSSPGRSESAGMVRHATRT